MIRPALFRLTLLFLAAAVGGCGGIAQRLVTNRVEQNIASNLPAEMPDGLHLFVCGAGGPLDSPNRSGPCLVVVAGDNVLLIDSGSAAARNVTRLGIRPNLLQRVFLTHFHSDHIDGLGEVATLRWAGSDWDVPLPVHGPDGVEKVVDGFNLAYSQDQVYRVAHHGEETVSPGSWGLHAESFPLPAEGEMPVVFEGGGLQVRAFAVDHRPITPAIGYRFDYKGRSAVVSGDTSKSANLIAASEGVDVLVHEALSRELVGLMTEGARRAGAQKMVKITQDITDYHASPVEAAESAEAAGAGLLLFHHVVPPLPISALERLYVAGVSDVYSGDFEIAVDGTVVSLPAGSNDIDVTQP